MIAFDDRAIHFPNALGTFVRIRVITNDIAKTNKVRALVLVGIGKHRLERFEIGVDITENGEAHRHNYRVKIDI